MARVPIADVGVARRPAGARPGQLAEPCLVCGRWIVDPAKAAMIEYTVYGDIMVDEEAGADETQGFFPIGPDCLRAVRRTARGTLGSTPG
jgi:hypothetical protein